MGPLSGFGQDVRVIHRAKQDMKNHPLLSLDATKDEVMAMRAASHRVDLATRHQRERQRRLPRLRHFSRACSMKDSARGSLS